MSERAAKLKLRTNVPYAKLTREELEAILEYKREWNRRRRKTEPDKIHKLERERYLRRKKRDPDKVRERARVKSARRHARLKDTPEFRRRKAEDQRRYRERHRERVKLIEANYRKRHQLRNDPRLLMDVALATLRKALPDTLPPHVRDDVTSDILLAVLECKLDVDQIGAKAKFYLAAHNRMFDQFGTVSLDEEIPGTDGLTYGDRLVYEEDVPDE